MAEWTKLHNGKHHNTHSSPDSIKQIKSTRKKWAGHVAHMGEGRNVYRVWESPKEKDHLSDQGTEGGWAQNGPEGDWLGGGGVDSPGSR
jgi:hypothetical protein